jgi:hypothetical protein
MVDFGRWLKLEWTRPLRNGRMLKLEWTRPLRNGRMLKLEWTRPLRNGRMLKLEWTRPLRNGRMLKLACPLTSVDTTVTLFGHQGLAGRTFSGNFLRKSKPLILPRPW